MTPPQSIQCEDASASTSSLSPQTVMAQMMQLWREEADQRRKEEEERRIGENARFQQMIAALIPAATRPAIQDVNGSGNSIGQLPFQTHGPQVQKAIVQPPPPLADDVTFRSFTEWKQKWNDYAVSVDLDKLPQPKQLIQLRQYLTDAMQRKLAYRMGVPPNSTLPLDDVISRIQDYVKQQTNESVRRLKFSQVKQEEGESFANFFIRLQEASQLIDLCKGKDCVDYQIRHAIVVGVRDEKLRKDILEMDSASTLEQVAKACEVYESVRESSKEIGPSQASVSAMSAYKKGKKANKHGQDKQQSAGGSTKKENPPKNKQQCNRCGNKPHTKDVVCPASEIICNKCEKKGHFAKVCFSKGSKEKKQNDKEMKSTTYSITAIRSPMSTLQTVETSCIGPPSPTISLHVEHGRASGNVEIVPDTGADTTVISLENFKTLGMKTSDLVSTGEVAIYNADGSRMECSPMGSFMAKLTYGSVTIDGWVNVLPKLPKPLLSWTDAQRLRVIPEDYPNQMPMTEGQRKRRRSKRKATRKTAHVSNVAVDQQKDAPEVALPKISMPPPPTSTPDKARRELKKARSLVDNPTSEDVALNDEMTHHLRSVTTQRVVTLCTIDGTSAPQSSNPVIGEMREASRNDPGYTKLLDKVMNGFPTDRDELDPALLPYWKDREKFYADGELVLVGPKVVVPQALRRNVLARLHDSHHGIEATKRWARQTVWWPAINSDITNTVQACERCQLMQPSQQQEPMFRDEAPTRPFESVSADLFSVAGKQFLVYADRLSGWVTVVTYAKDTTTLATITNLRKVFRDTGVPVRLRTDGGPQFTSHECRDFLRRWGVRHDVSTPHYPQSNGHAEAAVKAVKHLIMKVAPKGNIDDVEAFDRGLLELRNTPRPDGRSPAQILYGHPLRSHVPAHAKSFAPEWQAKAEECERRAVVRKDAMAKQYDSHAKPLPPIKPDSHVRVQDPVTKRWDRVGVVMGRGKTRDYLIKTSSGRVLWRNRRFIRAVPHPTPDPAVELHYNSDSASQDNPAPNATPPPRRSTRIRSKPSFERKGGGDV